MKRKNWEEELEKLRNKNINDVKLNELGLKKNRKLFTRTAFWLSAAAFALLFVMTVFLSYPTEDNTETKRKEIITKFLEKENLKLYMANGEINDYKLTQKKIQEDPIKWNIQNFNPSQYTGKTLAEYIYAADGFKYNGKKYNKVTYQFIFCGDKLIGGIIDVQDMFYMNLNHQNVQKRKKTPGINPKLYQSQPGLYQNQPAAS